MSKRTVAVTLAIVALAAPLGSRADNLSSSWMSTFPDRQGDEVLRCANITLAIGDGPTGVEYPHGRTGVTLYAGRIDGARCIGGWQRPKGWLAVHPILLYSNDPASDSWFVCKGHDYGLMHSTSAGGSMSWSRSYAKAPCGTHYYRLVSLGYVKTTDGTWQPEGSGPASSPVHYLS